MSQQSFADFMKKLQQDGELQRELHAKLGDPAAGIAPGDLARFAAGKGYQFDVAEIQGELSDKQLDGVAGGSFFDAFMKYDGRLFMKFDQIFPKIFPKI
jgi:predicted ribosomally synthesized peptide with nif11-like leader